MYVERLGARRAAYSRTTRSPPKQWHLAANRAFDSWGRRRRSPATRVAVIDSGIDGDHPELACRIADAKSFVGGSAPRRQAGARNLRRRSDRGRGRTTAIGMAGMSPVCRAARREGGDGDDLIEVEAEAKAIRWAVEQRRAA